MLLFWVEYKEQMLQTDFNSLSTTKKTEASVSMLSHCFNWQYWDAETLTNDFIEVNFGLIKTKTNANSRWTAAQRRIYQFIIIIYTDSVIASALY